jgi:RNA polymerase sigma factor (sigma-70 family)
VEFGAISSGEATPMKEPGHHWCLTALGQEMVESNLKLAGWFTDQVARRDRLSRDEIEAAAYEGLCHAAAHFDPGRCVKFSTYAVLWMHHCVNKARVASYVVHVPHRHLEQPQLHHYWNDALRALMLKRFNGRQMARMELRAIRQGNQKQIERWRERFDELVPRLDRRVRLVLRLRAAGWLLREIGIELGMTRERVRQLESEGIHQLQEMIRESY